MDIGGRGAGGKGGSSFGANWGSRDMGNEGCPICMLCSADLAGVPAVRKPSMAEDSLKTFMNSIQDMQKRVELLMLPAEKKMAQCQLKCFNDMSNADIVHRCAQGCQSQMQSVVTQVQGEFQGLIARLKTCEESANCLHWSAIETVMSDFYL
ncbi:hypothetical protein AK812_SmicGene1256 [Symbiodinium microadriaticum]|uniref:Protein FAM136A n=1 Tax=Symbiodinium microadriaticum TaxID=2951 RepID=A0A1Q9F4J3_SYMMI|nr:hypothetical protein AK812_SmicGene1256 [Symbiodinium microadriaticum]